MLGTAESNLSLNDPTTLLHYKVAEIKYIWSISELFETECRVDSNRTDLLLV